MNHSLKSKSFIVSLILATPLLTVGESVTEAGTWLITCERLYDGVSDEVVRDTRVLVRDGRIAEVGPGVEAPPDCEEVHLGNATLLPGLIDAHTHLTYSWTDTTSPPDFLEQYIDSPTFVVLRAGKNAEKTLRAGFTTVRDLGSNDGNDVILAQAVAMGLLNGPRIITGGPLYMPWGGGRNDIDWPPSGGVGNREEIVRKTREYMSSGCDWIKIYATTGTWDDTTGSPYFTTEELKAAVDIAHPRGHWVAAHVMGVEGARRAVEAGVRSIEHGSRLDDAVVREMARKGVYLVPTLYHLEWYANHGEGLGYGEGYEERLDALQETQFASLARARKAGVSIGSGSDAVFTMHGENAQEIVWLVQAGMTPLEALRAATSVNAALLGLEHEIGKLAPGYAADLVAVEGDPADDITAVTRPVFVMKGGKVILAP